MTLEIKQLSISNEQLCLFDSFNLRVGRGEICSVMGPSGSGKSTLLSYLCGAIDADAFCFKGKILLNRFEITQLPIEKRKIGILFQDDLLFPHMNVEQNLSFAIPQEISKEMRKQRIREALVASKLEGYEKRYPHTLSGGERARISLLRTLLAQPHALLLDEPFSKLDSSLRKEFRSFTFGYVASLHIPTILVTHDLKDIPSRSHVVRLRDPREAAC